MPKFIKMKLTDWLKLIIRGFKINIEKIGIEIFVLVISYFFPYQFILVIDRNGVFP